MIVISVTVDTIRPGSLGRNVYVCTRRCPPGEAVITVGGALKVDWCIHTVGPNYHHNLPRAEAEGLLRQCYHKAFALMDSKQAEVTALAVVSGGQYRAKVKKSIVMDILCDSVLTYITQTRPEDLQEQDMSHMGTTDSVTIQSTSRSKLREIHLVLYDPADVQPLIRSAERKFKSDFI